MNSVRKWIRDLFGFSGTEINGFVILIPLMLLFVFSEPVYRQWVAGRGGTADRDAAKLDSILAFWGRLDKEPVPAMKPVFFDFDPNTASVGDLRRLGLTEISANRIAAYRSKGGVFKIKSDLMKIYGLDSTLYKQLYDYIRLPTRIFPVSGRDRISSAPESRPWKRKNVNPTFDINTADTLQLESVYGIGPVLAARIIKFRNALGGFVSPEQLYEVYGLDSLVVKELVKNCFVKDDFSPEKININTADEKILSAHPYIRFKLARIIVSFRFQHGDFMEVNDIKKLSAVKTDELERLLPYLKVKD